MCEAAEEDKLGISFTCNKCDTRVSKNIRKLSYTKGVVIIQCPSCKSRHLIADHLGWYKEWTGTTMGSVDQYVDKLGQKVMRVDPSRLSFSEDEE